MAAKTGRTTLNAGQRSGVFVELKEHPELLAKIRAVAKADERGAGNWLRKRLLDLDRDGELFEPGDQGSLFAEI